MRGARLKALALAIAAVPAVAAVLAAAACRSDSPEGLTASTSVTPSTFTLPAATFRIGSPGGVPEPTVSRDPALTAAARRIIPILESAFPDSYAGLTEDHVNRNLLIFRRTDPALDRRVRAELPGITVKFASARYSNAQLRAFSARLRVDSDYWRAHDVSIAAVSESTFGSGVEVWLLAGADPNAERLMNEHYHDIPIQVLELH